MKNANRQTGFSAARLGSGLHAHRPGCTLSCTFKSTMMRAVIASALVAAASAKTLYKEYAPPAPRPLRTLRRNALRPPSDAIRRHQNSP